MSPRVKTSAPTEIRLDRRDLEKAFRAHLMSMEAFLVDVDRCRLQREVEELGERISALMARAKAARVSGADLMTVLVIYDHIDGLQTKRDTLTKKLYGSPK